MLPEPFRGFQPGKIPMVMLPAPFFTELLPLIDDLTELKVTLFALWALNQREGHYRYLEHSSLVASSDLAGWLTAEAAEAGARIAAGLDMACQRGTLLPAEIATPGGTEVLYFLNTARGRTAIAQIQSGRWRTSPDAQVVILPERPTVFAVYEQNIGPLTPMVVEHLKAAEADFGQERLTHAIQIAVDHNKRSWAYIKAVLGRWEREGMTREITERDDIEMGRQYVSGRFGSFIDS
jgi:DNA replication protein